MALPVDVETQPALLTLACRFMPYDQWLTTHVDAGWKVKQVKLWILSKCLGIPLDASMFPSSRAASSDVFDAATPSRQRYRPKSPITFAPDPRTLRRPVSPILFAKGTARRGKGKGKGKADEADVDAEPAPSPADDEHPHDTESDAADDGGSSSDEPAIYRSSPGPALPVPPPPRPPTPALPTHAAASKWARYNLTASGYTLIRFSTGQALEDDLSLTFFNLSSYELLELHAHGDVCAASSSPSASAAEHAHHTRTNSLYSQISTAAAAKDKDSPPQPICLVHLPRHDLHRYIQPYWEGPVRELRSVPVRSFVAPMPSFMDGYGYGYSGGDFSERAVALGIGNPPPLPLGMQMQRQGTGGWGARGGAAGEGMRVQNRIEWRPKHVVIKEGLFMLCTSREDANPKHIIPLEAFTSLKGADTLIAHLRNWDSQHQHQQSRTTTSSTAAAASTSSSTSHHKSKTRRPVFSTPASDVDDNDDDSDPEIRSVYPRLGRGRGYGRRSRDRLGSRGSTNPYSHSRSHSHSYSCPNPLLPKPKPKLHAKNTNEEGSSSPSPSSPSPSPSPSSSSSSASAGAPKTIAGEPAEDLHIVVLIFKSVDRMRRVVGTDRDGVVMVEYVRDRDKEGEREREKGGGKGTKKGTGRGRAFPWERERGKAKEGGKARRDWIPGFGAKRDSKGKEKDKEREVKEKGLALGVGIGRGLQDVRGQIARDREREREKEKEKERGRGKGKGKGKEKEKVALSDAEAEIVFARRSEADVRLEDGGVGEEKESAKGRNKAKAKADAAEADGGADADVDGDGDGDGDSDLDADRDRHADDLPFSPSHARRVHPHVELAGSSADRTPSADGGSESEAWSSPVFAHSDNTTDIGSDADLSDIARGGSRAHAHGGEAYRYGYRYGYQGPGFGFGPGAGAGLGEGGAEGVETVSEEKDRMEKERANLERQKERARREEEVKREEEKADWIILDVGSDLAYRSFLRVLHRHLAPGAPSDFIPSAPVFSVATPTSTTPTQTPTPFPSPTSPHTSVVSQNFQWLPLSGEEGTPSTFTRRASHPSPSSEASGHEFPQHPAALASLSRSSAKKTSQPFGVLPYPEWRLELTERAQRAGMGNVGRAMKWVRWESKAQLELDIEELLRRYSAGDDASDRASRESIRKKKREATSLKNRRKSTTSTLTGGKSSGRSGLKDWDREGEGDGEMCESDVSEDMGKMLEMSDSEEGSEAEWHGWMADLHRQRQIREKHAQEEVQRRAVEATEAAAAFEVSDGGYREPADATEIRNRRVLLEPKGMISVRPPGGPGLQERPGLTISQSTSATLHSPSSSDSLRRAALSPIDRASSPAGTFATSQTSRGSSLSPSPLGVRQHTLPVGSTLSHSTSMYASIRSDAHAAEQNLRRPSMPILTSEHMFSLHRGPVIAPQSSVIRSPTGTNFAFPSVTHSPPYSPSFASPFPAEEATLNAASSSRSPSEASSALSRRASSAGLANPGGSISRSASVLTRGSLLRRGTGKEAERVREKERRKEEKAREKEDRAKEKERARGFEREAKEARKVQRPKLSLATSSTHQLVSQPATGVVRNNPAMAGSALMRRVKSGSNLSEKNKRDEPRIPDSAKDASNAPQKKKRFVNRIVRKLDSAMDFVDGRQ